MQLIPLLMLISLLIGCASDGEVIEPAELIEFKAIAKADTLWTADVGSARSDSAEHFSPHVDGDAVFAAGYNGQVQRIDRISGKELWARNLKQKLIAGVSGDGSRLYVNSFEGHVFALSKDNGEVVWERQFSSEILAPPAAALDTVVLRTNDGNIIALNAGDGTDIWRYQFQVPVLTLHGYSSPLIVPGGVLLGLDDGNLLALTLQDGKPIWRTQISRPEGRSEIERLVDVDGDIIIDQQFIYAVNYRGKLAQIEPQRGSIVWSREMSSTSGVGVDDKIVYVSEPDGYVWALDKRTGSSMWKMEKLEGRRLTRPVPYEDYILVGDLEGYLHLLSKYDGSTVGRAQIDSSPIIAAPILDGDQVIVLSQGGVLQSLKIGEIADNF